jgi:phage terminase large subunit-like protein
MSARIEWITACPDWEARLLAGESLVPQLPLFEAEAARGLRIFKRLRIPDVYGTPSMADACGPWFFPIVETLFGCYDVDLHRRMLQEFFLLIPKGNSKSSYGGPLMLTAVIMNRRPEAGFSFIAPTIKVAEIAFNQAEGTIRLDPELDKLFHIQRHVRTITHRTTGASLKIKAADTDVVTGGKDVGTMIDETHVFAKKADAAAIFVEIRGALMKRKDGFLFQTTTQSKEPPSGQFKRELDRARAVRDGTLQQGLLPVLYEFPDELLEEHRWKERQYWHLVNPNLGRSIDEDRLAQELAQAESEGMDQLMLVASQHFNVQIGLRLTNDRWRGADHWEGAADAEACGTLEALLERCEVAVLAADGGGLDDLFGLAVAGREKGTKRWLYWAHAWALRDVLELRKEIAPKLLDFEGDGDLTLVDTAAEIIVGVSDIAGRVAASGLMPEKAAAGLDPYGIGAVVDAFSEIGLDEPRVVAVGQGSKLSSAVWSMEWKLRDRMLAHSGSRLMDWCVGNAKAEQRGDAVLITKEAAGKAKIDPLVAMFMATKLLEANPEAAGNDNGGVAAWLESLKKPTAAAA